MEEAFDLSQFGAETLPLVVSPKKATTREAFVEALRAYAPLLKGRLLEHGGILFRGFPLEGADDFSAAIEALGTGSSVNYIGGDSPRTKVTGAVYTSTEAPSAVKIPLHNELSFVRHFPKHIFFYCDVAPATGGETIPGDARRVYRALDEGVRGRLVEKQLKYVSAYYGRNWLMELVNKLQPSHKSWHDVFETTSRGEVERL